MKIKETDIVNVVIAGTAGQGVITLKRLIEFAAQKAGVDLILGAEQHGLAQREGAIISHTRYQKRATEPRKNLQSPLICYGDADLFISIEPVETLRRGLYASTKTTFCVNERDIPGIMITAGLEEYPSLNQILEILKKYTKEVYTINATKICLDKFKSNQPTNIFMLGFAIPTGKLPFIDIVHYEEVIREWLREPEINIEALHLGLKEGEKRIRKR